MSLRHKFLGFVHTGLALIGFETIIRVDVDLYVLPMHFSFHAASILWEYYCLSLSVVYLALFSWFPNNTISASDWNSTLGQVQL